MRCWHHLRESFKSSIIYLNNWGSHKPQHVNIISNKLHHTSQMIATQHISVSLQWSESCCSCHTGTQYTSCPLHPRSRCNLSIKSTLNTTLYIRKTLILTFFKVKFNCHLPFETLLKLLRQKRLLWAGCDTNIGKAWSSSVKQSVHFSLTDCENVRVNTISYSFLYLQTLVQWLYSIFVKLTCNNKQS